MFYRIDNKVVFYPEDKTMGAINASRDELHGMILLTPAARCLTTLLDNHGQLVTQKMFMEAVWERYDLEPSTNSLYQSISAIRKNFSLLGIEKPVIVTRPREGFFIPDDINVEIVDDYEHVLPTASGEIRKTEIREENEHVFIDHLPVNFKAHIKYVFLLITFVTMASIFIPENSSTRNHFSHFITSERNDKRCIIEFNRDSTDFIKHNKFMDSHHYNCAKYPYVYVEAYAHAPKLSVIRCNVDMKKSADPLCISEYFADYQ